MNSIHSQFSTTDVENSSPSEKLHFQDPSESRLEYLIRASEQNLKQRLEVVRRMKELKKQVLLDKHKKTSEHGITNISEVSQTLDKCRHTVLNKVK